MSVEKKSEEKKKVRPIEDAEAEKIAGGPDNNTAPDGTPWAPGHSGYGGPGQGE